MSAAPDPWLEPARSPTPARHLSVVPPTPPPAPAPAPTRRRDDLMWLALVGPVGGLGAFGLLAWAGLNALVSPPVAVLGYAVLVLACVVARAVFGGDR